MNGPTIATIKRLFSVSGNRCAFPKCQNALVHGDKVTGRVCHIKAASARGPRYDPSQTPQERHGFENLVLMCPIHADVIDADVQAYTVDRLTKMKTEHEQSAESTQPLSDLAAATLAVAVSGSGNRTTTNFYDQRVTSYNQTGGITAHTVAIEKLQREMGDEMKKTISKDVPRDKQIVVWSIAGNDETYALARQIFDFMRADGFKMVGDGPYSNVYLGPPPSGVKFYPGPEHNAVHVGLPDGSETPEVVPGGLRFRLRRE